MKSGASYVGVTGVMNAAEAESILVALPEDSDRLLMVGVLASSKTIRGVKNKWPGRYPKFTDIKTIFVPHRRVLNLIHYSTDDMDTVDKQMSFVKSIAGPEFCGFQLNMKWPSRIKLEDYRNAEGVCKIVLQVGRGAMDVIDNSPRKFGKMLATYRHLIDYVLIDPSGGLGRPFDIEKTRNYLYSAASLDMCGLAVAGGLSPTTLHLLEPLIEEFPDLSIDSEGRLRTPQPEDALDLLLAKEYVKSACEMFSRKL